MIATVMLDRGIPLRYLDDMLYMNAPFISHAKIMWGLGWMLPVLPERLRVYRTHKVPVFCGGTLYEYHRRRGEFTTYLDWLKDAGFEWLEISDGTIDLPHADKLADIREAGMRGFHVIGEVGRKAAVESYTRSEWMDRICDELDAGVKYVTCEGRESGDAGIYGEDGQLNTALIESLRQLTGQLIFEATAKRHQVSLMARLGRDVNLGNILPDDVLGLAALRAGLRPETLEMP